MRFRISILFISLVPLLMLATGCSRKNSGDKVALSDSTKNSAEQLSELIKQHPDDADLYYNRASLYMKKGDGSAALNDMQNAVRMDSSNAEYFLLLGDIYFSKLF